MLFPIIVSGCTSTIATVSGSEFMRLSTAYSSRTNTGVNIVTEKSVTDVENIDGTISRVTGTVTAFIHEKNGLIRKFKPPFFINETPAGFTIAEQSQPRTSYEFREIELVECKQFDWWKTGALSLGILMPLYLLDTGY